MSTVLPTAIASLEPLADSSCGRVLIADDDAMSLRILQSSLENWGYQVIVAEDGARAWQILQEDQPPELLILDWVMPKIDGIELCRRIRERQGHLYQYILLLTGKDHKQDVVRGLEAGADDYLTKPFDRNELQARLRAGKRILTLQRDLINAREELRFQATHDPLTGIWNRGAVLALLQSELERAIRLRTATSVLMLDLDHFKAINDTYGHLTGDVVLQELVKRIAQSVRSYDLVGRYGGEEFLVVLPSCAKTKIEQGANRIRAAVASAPILVGQTEIFVTVSIGGAVTEAGNESPVEILVAADRALYQAKNKGRDRIAIV